MFRMWHSSGSNHRGSIASNSSTTLSNHLHPLSGWLNMPLVLWPWAEGNQGTLAFIAILVAAAIAIYTLRRTTRSEERPQRAFIEFVLTVADRGIDLTHDAILTCDGAKSRHDRLPLATWDFLQGNASATLREVLSIKPTAPDLLLLVNGLDRMLAIRPDHSVFHEGERAGLMAVLGMLEVQRAKIERLRTPSDLERICRWLGLSRYQLPIETPLTDALSHPASLAM
jgi:hypothetical protein